MELQVVVIQEVLIGYVQEDEGGSKMSQGRCIRVTFLTRLLPSEHNQLKPIV